MTTAALLEASNQPLQIIDDLDVIAPRIGEVLVEVHSCGVCHSDLSVVDGAFPAPGQIVLGHEAAGTVVELGAGVQNLAVGDHVVLTPAASCGHCYWCVRGEHSICPATMTGLTSGALPDGETGLSRQGQNVFRGLGVGGFSKVVVTPEAGAVKIDPDIPLEVAAVIGCAMQTGVGAVINTAKVEPGATVLVMGLGGIGLATVQGARLAGASRIIVSDPVSGRRDAAAAMGATDQIDPLEDDVMAKTHELTGVGADYAFECAGVASLVEVGIFATRAGGTTVAVGAPGIEQSFTVNPAVLFASAEKKLLGCLLGSCNSRRDIPLFLALWQAGRLDLESMVSHRRPLSEINDAFDDMRAQRGLRTILSL